MDGFMLNILVWVVCGVVVLIVRTRNIRFWQVAYDPKDSSPVAHMDAISRVVFFLLVFGPLLAFFQRVRPNASREAE